METEAPKFKDSISYIELDSVSKNQNVTINAFVSVCAWYRNGDEQDCARLTFTPLVLQGTHCPQPPFFPHSQAEL